MILQQGAQYSELYSSFQNIQNIQTPPKTGIIPNIKVESSIELQSNAQKLQKIQPLLNIEIVPDSKTSLIDKLIQSTHVVVRDSVSVVFSVIYCISAGILVAMVMEDPTVWFAV